MKQKISRLHLTTALLIWVGTILYSMWSLYSIVSKLKPKLLEVQPLSEHVESITNLYYITAFWFLVLGTLLGLGIAAMQKQQT